MTATLAFLADMSADDSNRRAEKLRARAPEGVNVTVVDSRLSEGEIIEQLKDAHVIVPWGVGVSVELARQLPNLRLIQLTSAGFNIIDLAGMADLGVKVANNGGANAVSVAEHAIALMLCVCRAIMPAWENTREGKWRDGLGRIPARSEINGKTVGIVGFGNIGRQVARRLSGFDVTLLYYDVEELPVGRHRELGAEAVSLDELLRRSDIVTVHVPLMPSTHRMISAREFSLMKPTAIFINTCRGPVVDEEALIKALQEGEIFGAGLDVLEEEPTPRDNPLLSMPNVVVTPHWAGGTGEGEQKAAEFALANARRLDRGQPLLSVLSPELQAAT